MRDLVGQTARIEIVDAHSGGWGHIDLDRIEFADTPHADSTPPGDSGPTSARWAWRLLAPTDRDRVVPSVPTTTPEDVFGPEAPAEAVRPEARRRGRRQAGDRAGESATLTFALTWHFPNLSLQRTHLPPDLGRHYATRFGSAHDVARYLAENFDRLYQQTKLWHDTWYDSTLPYWFLDRTFANTSILATSTCHRFRDGRFYGWEGVGCCAGTCTHVWHYAQSVARLFPELERHTRERVDYGPASASTRRRRHPLPRRGRPQPGRRRPGRARSCASIASTRCRPTTRS